MDPLKKWGVRPYVSVKQLFLLNPWCSTQCATPKSWKSPTTTDQWSERDVDIFQHPILQPTPWYRCFWWYFKGKAYKSRQVATKPCFSAGTWQGLPSVNGTQWRLLWGSRPFGETEGIETRNEFQMGYSYDHIIERKWNYKVPNWLQGSQQETHFSKRLGPFQKSAQFYRN